MVPPQEEAEKIKGTTNSQGLGCTINRGCYTTVPQRCTEGMEGCHLGTEAKTLPPQPTLFPDPNSIYYFSSHQGQRKFSTALQRPCNFTSLTVVSL